MLVHFAYSFVAGSFSDWPALIINLIALTLAAYSVFFLVREIWEDDVAALFVMAVFGTMWGVINMAVFFRMYCLLMMWAGWLVFWHLRQKKNYFLLAPLVFLGALTHYYFFVLLVITALYYGIDLIIKRKWRDILLYIGSMAVAAVFYLLATYPFIVAQFTSESDRAAQAFGQLRLSGFVGAVVAYVRLLSKSVCGDIPTLLLAVLAILAAGIWLGLKRQQIQKEIAVKLISIAVPALLYLLIVARIAPYTIDRYIAIILPALAVVFWGLFYQAFALLAQNGRAMWAALFPKLPKLERVLVAMLLVILCLFGWRRVTVLPDHCYQGNQSIHDMFAVYLPENNNLAVLQVCTKYTRQHVAIHNRSLQGAKYLQEIEYENLDKYIDFPEEGSIILLVGSGVLPLASGAEVAEELWEISGKEKVTFIGYAVSGEAYLLE
jgi:hypothetical protein